MDSVPFTLFFMVLLLGFQGNMVRPYAIETPTDLWPEECADQNYCHIKPKDYPSDEELTKLFWAADIAIPSPAINETEYRAGENDICRNYNTFESVYMIKDEHSKIRYALNIPKVYSIQVEIRPCQDEQMLGEWEGSVKCEQRYTEIPFLVLSQDKNNLEITKTKLPTTCAPVFVREY